MGDSCRADFYVSRKAQINGSIRQRAYLLALVLNWDCQE